MQKKAIVWDGAKTRERLGQLLAPGVIGLYNSVEVTEVLGVQGKTLTNILTLAVAEPFETPAEVARTSVFLNEKRLRLPGTDWYIGIAQHRLTLETFLERVVEFSTTNQWKLGSHAIQTSTLAAVPPQFVPSDGSSQHSWNGVLKNNFFEGSHVLELFDTTKQYLQFLLDDSRNLTNLVNIVGEYLPIRVDGMSDRLGNVVIQLPVTVVSTKVRGSQEGDQSVAVAWHPDVPPRRVRVSAEIWQDSTVTHFDSSAISTGEVKLQLHSRGGGARTHIWDEEKQVLLSATSPVTFFTGAFVSETIEIDPTKRNFLLLDSTGKQVEQFLQLTNPTEPRRFVGSPVEATREQWVAQRVFDESVSNLKERKEFVQYGRDETKEPKATGKPDAEEYSVKDEDLEGDDATPEIMSRRLARRMAALDDLRWLMQRHGEEGAWLWDPFLNADDVLRTLFFCPHPNVKLRALTAGKKPPGIGSKLNVPKGTPQREIARLAREREDMEKREQAGQLEAAKGNCHGLQLEFRIRVGAAGWGFHDRFLIFPRAQGSALAWSLGTSINSFGDEHHILQKVTHGEPIAQAFQDLWEQLEGDRYLIWKTPANGEKEQ